MQSPVVVSHTFTVSSADPLARDTPSPSTARQFTQLVCPLRVRQPTVSSQWYMLCRLTLKKERRKRFNIISKTMKRRSKPTRILHARPCTHVVMSIFLVVRLVDVMFPTLLLLLLLLLPPSSPLPTPPPSPRPRFFMSALQSCSYDRKWQPAPRGQQQQRAQRSWTRARVACLVFG